MGGSRIVAFGQERSPYGIKLAYWKIKLLVCMLFQQHLKHRSQVPIPLLVYLSAMESGFMDLHKPLKEEK